MENSDIVLLIMLVTLIIMHV
jgi:hypothetical protein